jgi:hypothetical protein
VNSLTYRLQKEMQKSIDKAHETIEIDAHGHQTESAVAEQKDLDSRDGDVCVSEASGVSEPGRSETTAQIA